MKELLDKINETFENSINNSSEDVALQLKIVKNNINRLFDEAMNNQSSEVVNQPVSTPEVPTNTDVNTNTNNKTILIVDDSVIVRNYLQKLCGTKYYVSSLTSGQDCINEISNIKPDLLLLDLMMPGLDGFAVLEHIKNNNINVPTIIISGDTTKESIDRAFQYNVIDMIEKPFSESTIMDKIERILN